MAGYTPRARIPRGTGVAERNLQTYHDRQCGDIAEVEVILGRMLTRAKHQGDTPAIEHLRTVLGELAARRQAHTDAARRARRLGLALVARATEKAEREGRL